MSAAENKYSRLILSGGSSGIGAAILERFLKEHPTADAINLSRSEPPLLRKYAQRIQHFTIDLSQSEQVEHAAELIEAHNKEHPPTGSILLVNNSGIGQHAPIQESPLETQLKTIDLNVKGVVHLSMSLLPYLLEQGGKIVSISSTSAFQATPCMSTYGATKTFLLHWSLALSEDLRGTKVSTLVFCPGATETPFIPQAGFTRPIRSFWAVQSVTQVTDQLFAAIESNRTVAVSGRMNRFLAALSKTAPCRLSARVAGWLMRRAKQD